jgi:predicted amidophosphoribosyltransferase
VAQQRARIAQNEYYLIDNAAVLVGGKDVILIDDRVTTGHTLAGVARLLRKVGACAVTPLVLDRTISARVLQRAGRQPVVCPHVEAFDT